MSFMSETDCLSFCHVNIQSLLAGVNLEQHIPSQVSKLDEIQATLIDHHKFHVISLSETWLKASTQNENISIENYSCFRKDRPVGRGGGVCVYVLDSVPCIHRQDIESNCSTEFLWIELQYSSYKVMFCVCYRPPGQNAESINTFLSDMQSSFDKIYSEQYDCIIITGDFNDRCVSWNDDHPSSELKNKLRDLVTFNNMFQLISQPTHYTKTSAHILDLIITDSPGYVTNCGTLDPLGDLHHVPVFGKLNMTKYRTPTISREVWHYNNADLVGLNTAIQESDWSILTECDNVDTATTYLTNHFSNTARNHVPVRKIRLRSKDKPWFSSSVRKLIRLRNRWSGIFNRTNNPTHKIIRNIYRSRVKNEMKRQKNLYFDEQMQKLNNPELSNKKYWNIVKQLLGNKIKKSIPTLIDNNTHYTTDQKK